LAKATPDHDDEPDQPAEPATEGEAPAVDDADDEPTTETTGTDHPAATADPDDQDPDAEPGAAKATATGAATATTKKSTTTRARAGRNPTGGGGSRRHRLAAMEAKRKRDARRRTLILLGICLVCALGLLAYPVFLFAQDASLRSRPVGSLGVSADTAGCLPVVKHPATGNQQHVPVGTVVPYTQLPPDSGAHYDTPAPFQTHFYTVQDRPQVETLVHNLEHGYLLIWYNADMSASQIKVLKYITRTYSGSDPRDKVIAAPWDTKTDGGAFDGGTNLVLARWYADPKDPGNAAKQQGIRLACTEVSGAVIDRFHNDYPVADSPEPNGA